MYGAAADIYSLGLILLELLNHFFTVMERRDVFTAARNGVMPKGMQNSFPEETKLALWMLQVGCGVGWFGGTKALSTGRLNDEEAGPDSKALSTGRVNDEEAGRARGWLGFLLLVMLCALTGYHWMLEAGWWDLSGR